MSTDPTPESSSPRTWELPPEPSNEITAVRDRYGQIFQRVEDPDRPRVTWHGTTFLDDPDVPDFVLGWPMLLSDLGLTESLRAFTTKVSSLQRRVSARFPTPIPRLDDETEIAVYRVAQEALGNALRHADAHNIELVMRSARDGVLLI